MSGRCRSTRPPAPRTSRRSVHGRRAGRGMCRRGGPWPPLAPFRPSSRADSQRGRGQPWARPAPCPGAVDLADGGFSGNHAFQPWAELRHFEIKCRWSRFATTPVDSSPLRPPVAIHGWGYTPVAPTAPYLRCGCGALDHPQLPARLFRHALWGPDRFVDDVDAGVGDSRQGQQVVADVRHHVGGHRAAERGQRHLHVDACGLDRDVVDQPDIDDVDRDLGVQALPENFDQLLGLDCRVRRDLRGDGGLLRGPRQIARFGGVVAHGFSNGRPASRQALVPPPTLTTYFTPTATAISDATADRSPAWQTNTVLSSNFCAVGLARIELSTTCLAPGR